MITALAIVLVILLLLAIVGTLVGIAQGSPFACFNWCLNSGEWVNLLGTCLAVIFCQRD